ncbi:MAG TPA: hypothetical protein VFI23_17150 [Rhizomicrobium sp.]|nr:hypothetical protein [Rhizomicrobium sp.]
MELHDKLRCRKNFRRKWRVSARAGIGNLWNQKPRSFCGTGKKRAAPRDAAFLFGNEIVRVHDMTFRFAMALAGIGVEPACVSTSPSGVTILDSSALLMSELQEDAKCRQFFETIATFGWSL